MEMKKEQIQLFEDRKVRAVWNDPEIGIEWSVPAAYVGLSDRDWKHPFLKNFESPFGI